MTPGIHYLVINQYNTVHLPKHVYKTLLPADQYNRYWFNTKICSYMSISFGWAVKDYTFILMTWTLLLMRCTEMNEWGISLGQFSLSELFKNTDETHLPLFYILSFVSSPFLLCLVHYRLLFFCPTSSFFISSPPLLLLYLLSFHILSIPLISSPFLSFSVLPFHLVSILFLFFYLLSSAHLLSSSPGLDHCHASETKSRNLLLAWLRCKNQRLFPRLIQVVWQVRAMPF